MKLTPLIIDEKQTAVCLKLDGNYKRGDVFYWNNNFDYAQKGYYEVVDDSYKKDNLYLCIKKAAMGKKELRM